MDNEKEIIWPPSKEAWLPAEEAIFMKKFFSAKEQEYIETAGRGYKALGITNENSLWLAGLESMENIAKTELQKQMVKLLEKHNVSMKEEDGQIYGYYMWLGEYTPSDYKTWQPIEEVARSIIALENTFEELRKNRK